MIQATKLVINTASGPITPISPGKFIEAVRRNKHSRIETSLDDVSYYTGIEAGSFDDMESPLKFTQKRLKFKEIYDADLLSAVEENRPYAEMAVTHFGITELHKLSKKLKDTFKTDGDMTVDLIQDLSLEFMKEMGSDGHLILMKNSVLIVSVDDFTVEMVEIFKKHKNTRMMCGALFCSRPFRVKKATFGGRLILR